MHIRRIYMWQVRAKAYRYSYRFQTLFTISGNQFYDILQIQCLAAPDIQMKGWVYRHTNCNRRGFPFPVLNYKCTFHSIPWSPSITFVASATYSYFCPYVRNQYHLRIVWHDSIMKTNDLLSLGKCAF